MINKTLVRREMMQLRSLKELFNKHENDFPGLFSYNPWRQRGEFWFYTIFNDGIIAIGFPYILEWFIKTAACSKPKSGQCDANNGINFTQEIIFTSAVFSCITFLRYLRWGKIGKEFEVNAQSTDEEQGLVPISINDERRALRKKRWEDYAYQILRVSLVTTSGLLFNYQYVYQSAQQEKIGLPDTLKMLLWLLCTSLSILGYGFTWLEDDISTHREIQASLYDLKQRESGGSEALGISNHQ